MTYIYDVTLNFNETLYDFFEWNNRDSLVHVRKIPIFKVSNEIFIDIISNIVKVSDIFLNKIMDKTDTYGKKSKSFTSCLIRCDDNIIALKFNEEGVSKYISSIGVEEELDILEIKVNTTKSFEYQILNSRKTLLTTRYDNMNKTYIERESDTERRIAFDLDVGEQKELTLSIKSDSAKKIRILQETEEYFVVVMDRNNATITQTDGNGVCHTYNMLNAPVYALMKKDDFFNDVPVFLYVENYCWDLNSLFL